MAGIFYNLGKMLGPKVRKGKWVWKSLTADADEAITAEREVGLDIASAVMNEMAMAASARQKFVSAYGSKLARRVANKKIKFNFFVYLDTTPNAFAVPGGFIFVSSSLLDLYGEDPDMSAFVIAHEMGHVVRKHAVNRLVNSAALGAVTRALPVKGKISAMLKSTGLKFFQSAYSQSQEFEADEFGVKLTRAAGFKADAAVKALKKLAECHKNESRNATDEYFSTHPATIKRISAIKQLLLNLKK
ncbi:MAG: M48 family metallopeptidase [Sedimentisphaeraceae bacterium JB056]